MFHMRIPYATLDVPAWIYRAWAATEFLRLRCLTSAFIAANSLSRTNNAATNSAHLSKMERRPAAGSAKDPCS